jgi:hypothetical protein
VVPQSVPAQCGRVRGDRLCERQDTRR